MKKIFSLLACAALLTSCEPGPNGNQAPQINKANIGAVAGALAGGFAGSNVGKGSGKTLAIAAGALGGAYIGNQLGASLDRADQAYYNRTAQSAFETAKTGTSTRWQNPDSGNGGVFTPTKTFQTQDGNFCREFTQTIMVGGKKQEGYGTACRQPDGSWQIVQQ
jgi:surface antigen